MGLPSDLPASSHQTIRSGSLWMTEDNKSKEVKLALLVDAENVRIDFLPIIMGEASALGAITVRRLYGDLLRENMKAWHSLVHTHALTPVHVPARAKGKNAADMKLAIDAIDLLHQKRLDGFCIASSDSDFTALANRIREDGVKVYGFGEKKVTVPYVAACDRFFYCDLLLENLSSEPVGAKKMKLPTNEILAAVDDATAEDGWALLGSVGSVLSKRQPDFDPRNYKFKKLSDLVGSIADLTVESVSIGNGTVVKVRRR